MELALVHEKCMHEYSSLILGSASSSDESIENGIKGL
jgi:hypothetical protein